MFHKGLFYHIIDCYVLYILDFMNHVILVSVINYRLDVLVAWFCVEIIFVVTSTDDIQIGPRSNDFLLQLLIY